jgi:hypothetical protein
LFELKYEINLSWDTMLVSNERERKKKSMDRQTEGQIDRETK